RPRPARSRKIRRGQIVGRDGRALIRRPVQCRARKQAAAYRVSRLLTRAVLLCAVLLEEDVLKQDFDYKQDPKHKFQKSLISDGLKRFLPFISLIALCALIPLGEYFLLEKEPVFLTLGNLAAIARQTAVITIMAMGMTMVMVSGGIDLSVGSILAISSVV